MSGMEFGFIQMKKQKSYTRLLSGSGLYVIIWGKKVFMCLYELGVWRVRIPGEDSRNEIGQPIVLYNKGMRNLDLQSRG